jgi:hypothetical protein
MITGTDLHAFELCPRRAWLKKRNVIWGRENQNIQLGRQNADEHYQKSLKELHLPSVGASGSVVDFINFSLLTVHENKKDSKAKSADVLQLLAETVTSRSPLPPPAVRRPWLGPPVRAVFGAAGATCSPTSRAGGKTPRPSGRWLPF